MERFCHRTFNDTDFYILFPSLNFIIQNTVHWSLLSFNKQYSNITMQLKPALNYFTIISFQWKMCRQEQESILLRPQKKSSCKRLNMYLRWMVRNDDKGVDFGIWKTISPCSIDLPGRCACSKGCETF